MSITELGAIGEFIGSIAILVTLAYLAVQTTIMRRETATAARANTYNAFQAINHAIVASEEVALLYERGLRDPMALSEGETLRFFMLLREAMNAYAELYQQYRSGVIREQDWRAMNFDIYAQTPGVKWFIEFQAKIYPEDFVSHINSINPNPDIDAVGLMTGALRH